MLEFVPQEIAPTVYNAAIADTFPVMPGNRTQTTSLDANTIELLRHLVRTSVDMRAATPDLHELTPSALDAFGDRDFEVTPIFDLVGALTALRELPDAAGTAAFVAAYNARIVSTRTTTSTDAAPAQPTAAQNDDR